MKIVFLQIANRRTGLLENISQIAELNLLFFRLTAPGDFRPLRAISIFHRRYSLSVNSIPEHLFFRKNGIICKGPETEQTLPGICFGGQLLAKLLGAKVTAHQCWKLEVMSSANPAAQTPILARISWYFSGFQWHADTFGIPPAPDAGGREGL